MGSRSGIWNPSQLWTTSNQKLSTWDQDLGSGIQVSCGRPQTRSYQHGIKIWDLESKSVVDDLKPEVISMSGKARPADCISLAWSTDGQTLFAGYTDNLIRVWQVSRAA